MRAWEDLTNVQFPMLNSHPKGEAAACVRSCPASVEHLAIRHPLRMRIEHWELSIGQIPGRIQGSGFCQVIFARALSSYDLVAAMTFVPKTSGSLPKLYSRSSRY